MRSPICALLQLRYYAFFLARTHACSAPSCGSASTHAPVPIDASIHATAPGLDLYGRAYPGEGGGEGEGRGGGEGEGEVGG